MIWEGRTARTGGGAEPVRRLAAAQQGRGAGRAGGVEAGAHTHNRSPPSNAHTRPLRAPPFPGPSQAIKQGCFNDLLSVICKDTTAEKFKTGLFNAGVRCADFNAACPGGDKPAPAAAAKPAAAAANATAAAKPAVANATAAAKEAVKTAAANATAAAKGAAAAAKDVLKDATKAATGSAGGVAASAVMALAGAAALLAL